MNTTKSVYNRLFSKKTELETHKVELSIIGDIEKEIDKFKKQSALFRKLDDTILKDRIRILKAKDTFEKNLPKYNKAIDSTPKLISNAKNVLIKAEKASKDLGLNPKDIEGYKEVEQYIGWLEENIKYTTSVLNELKSLI